MVTATIGLSTLLASISISLASQKGGCIIVDSTRKGKRFPDSMSKTIPIWTCVLNRAIVNYLRRMHCDSKEPYATASTNSITENVFLEWDCSLHLPLWISETEKASIEDRIEDWTKQLEASGADIGSVASFLQKPLRPLWISQQTVIWLNEVPDYDSWDFTPIILVSASSPSGIFQQRTTSEFSWHYIPGAGDDEESWARGLSPDLFWKHCYDLMNSGPDLCNQKVADIVEKDRVYRAQRGQSAPQVAIKPQKLLVSNGDISTDDTDEKSIFIEDDLLCSGIANNLITSPTDENFPISWVGSTDLAVGTTQIGAAKLGNECDCILNCDTELVSCCLPDADSYLHLPIVTSKFDRFSLLSNLPSALNFAKLNLSKGKSVLICCGNGSYDGGKSFKETCITKLEMRKRLIFICKFATSARPSRGNLKQVFSFLSIDRMKIQLHSDAVHSA